MLAMVIASGLFAAAAAVSVDTARWYAEMERIQKAADAAAVGAVPYLPYEFDKAVSRAKDIAARNGYPERGGVSVAVEPGAISSQLKVTISSPVHNIFGSMFSASSTTVSRYGVADFKAASPMGSPCNTFGNEPDSGGGPSSVTPVLSAKDENNPSCTSAPQFWAVVEGPATSKGNGDRYMNKICASGVHRCDSDGQNSEYDPNGYFWSIHVSTEAVNRPIELQLYDPAFVPTGANCEGLRDTPSSDNLNPYVKDARKRYAIGSTNRRYVRPVGVNGATYCSGDYLGSSSAPTTSFLLRHQNDSHDPLKGEPEPGCNKQYKGTSTSTAPRVNSELDSSDTSKYNEQMAQMFHNWVEFCTFTPDAPGDYYMQVRTNVAFGGEEVQNSEGRGSLISRNNPEVVSLQDEQVNAAGVNAFAIRAVAPGFESHVSVAGYERMPIFANSPDSTTSTFHLIRVLPGAASQFVTFNFFDIADVGTSSAKGTVRVILPEDAEPFVGGEHFPGGCTSVGGYYSSVATLPNCTAIVQNSRNNGQLQSMTIPIPSDYSCEYEKTSGCWYKVEVSLTDTVTDITTWDATVTGDPVRLIE